ncbi:MAG: PDZ domain-containing protein, partial [Chloroflexota bacterium]
MTTNGYYRFPTIYKNKVVFVCEDDLWEVSARGGTARRLTANLGRVSHPVYSPNGRHLAFVGREDGDSEIYLMPAAGGVATRLTYLGSMTTTLGWTADSKKILFNSNRGQPFHQLTWLYQVDLAGNRPERLHYGPVRSVSYSDSGAVALGRTAVDSARWKRYRGGTMGEVWLDATGKNRFKQILSQLDGNITYPMWVGNRIYFLSDHEGVGNIYSCTKTGKSVQRHTHHEDFYARYPTTDGRRIVYQAGADLYIFDPDQSESTPIKIKLNSPQIQRQRKFVRAANHIEQYALHPKGHSVTFSTRGKVFGLSNWDGATFQYGERHGVRYRCSEWLNDGKRLIMVSDESGEETLEIHTDLSQGVIDPPIERLDGLDIGRPLYLTVSPKEDVVVFGNHRHELIWVDLESKTLKVLDKSDHGRISGIDWSYDGHWVAYALATSLHTSAIKVCYLPTGETHFITTPNSLYDINPSFDPAGKYLYFISYRDFNPVSDSLYFDHNFPRGGRPYLVTLQNQLGNPFVSKITPETKPANNDASKNNGEKDEDPSVQIDLEGIEHRVVAFPVSEGRYWQIEGIHKNKVLFTSLPVEGQLGQPRYNPMAVGKGLLEMYDLAERKLDFVVNGLNGFDMSRDHHFLIYRSGRNMRVLRAGEKPDNNASGFTKKSGWLDLKRIRLAINPPDEWTQMLQEAWRLQRDHFWTEDMAQVDWPLIYTRYEPLLERVTTRAEFSDLMWEMQGELGTSHAYEIGGDYRPNPHYYQGSLAADFEYDAQTNGYRITHIVQGDSWIEDTDSPLNRLGNNVEVGDTVLAIDGQRLSETITPEQLLVNRSRVEIQLI